MAAKSNNNETNVHGCLAALSNNNSETMTCYRTKTKLREVKPCEEEEEEETSLGDQTNYSHRIVSIMIVINQISTQFFICGAINLLLIVAIEVELYGMTVNYLNDRGCGCGCGCGCDGQGRISRRLGCFDDGDDHGNRRRFR
ncbi:hypothetical protein ACFE04_006694 [Oxalis oulophora]